ncbi:response regulator [Eisenbergiella porci]|uniref:hypothetical protein n=1 Tax=Eisenbergiella porci TaxID=2652274 RepID=UPI001F2B939C|nr:hypothetical protein [Eisenbergiella porci]
MAYKVMAADDEAIMRKAMTTLINWEDLGCELIYVASTGTEVMERLELLKPVFSFWIFKCREKTGLKLQNISGSRSLRQK